MNPASVAVVMPVREEAASIETSIRAVFGGSIPPDEVIVVDGLSADDTPQLVRRLMAEYPSLRLVSNERRTIPAALNIGWQSTACDIVVRVDGHAVVSSNYVELARRHLASGDWQGVGGRKVPVASTATGRAIAAAMSSRWGIGNSRYHYATQREEADHVPFGAYMRTTIASLGGWDERILVNQDFEFDYRLRQRGGRILFEPAMTSAWACSERLSDLAHQYRRYGRGKAAVVYEHPRSLRMRHLAPVASVLGLSTLSIISVLLPDTKASRFARRGLCAYSLGVGAAGLLGAGGQCDPAARWRTPAVLSMMHNAQGVGFLTGLLHAVRQRSPSDQFRRRPLSVRGEERDLGHV